MTIPVEFTSFAKTFHQDSMAGYDNLEGLVYSRVDALPNASKIIIHRYLVHLINEPMSQKEMMAAWTSGDPAFGPNGADFRAFYRLLVDRREKKIR